MPDEIIIEMMRPYLDEADSWILDGFPRNESQAEALDEMLTEIGAELDAAVALEAPDEALVKRLSGQRTSEATGRIYHVEYDPPPESSREDPGPFIQRKDDREEALRRRLRIYHDSPSPSSTTTPREGPRDGGRHAGLRSTDPTMVINDLEVLRPDPESNELTLTALHLGAMGRAGERATLGLAGGGRFEHYGAPCRRRTARAERPARKGHRIKEGVAG